MSAAHTLSGQILAIMETWPLQLSIDADGQGPRSISLAEDCVVMRDGRAVDPGNLRVGDCVGISGRPAAAGGLTALRIDIDASRR